MFLCSFAKYALPGSSIGSSVWLLTSRLQVRVLPGEPDKQRRFVRSAFFIFQSVSQTCNPEKKPYVSSLYSLSLPIKKFYIGVTSDIEKRVHYHNMGRSPYTRHKGSWFLVYSEIYTNKHYAIFRERVIKTWKSSKRIIEQLNINIDEIGNSGFVRTE